MPRVPRMPLASPGRELRRKCVEKWRVWKALLDLALIERPQTFQRLIDFRV